MSRQGLAGISLAVLVGLVATASAVEAQARTKGRTDRVRVAYIEPKNPEHRSLYEQLKKGRVLERLRTAVSPVKLPARLLLKTEGCDGTINAWYHDRVVQVCYEYLAEVARNAPHQPVGELTREAAILGATVDVFLHEIAHALFDMLEIPILGREEDAADQVAAYMMLQFGTREARSLIAGTAYLYATEVMKTSPRLQDFADAHGVPAQRFFNLLCIAYGSDPKAYQDVVDKGFLPHDRSQGCEDEYTQVAHAFETLILPHIDRKRRQRVRARLRAAKWDELLPPSGAPSARPNQ